MAKIIDGFVYRNINKAAQLLRQGEVIAFPTETVYGLGADVYNKKAVAKIFEIKERPFFDPVIVHIANLKQLEEVAWIEDERIYLLAKNFWPGPLTLVLPKQKKIPYLVTAGLDTVGVRMPSNVIALSLIQSLGRPIAAPSANLFTHLSPTTADHAFKQLGSKIKIILDGGKTICGVESTILLIKKNARPVCLRAGGLPIEEIEKIVGKVEVSKKQSSKVLAPGNLKFHYAPRKPLIIVKNEEEISEHFKDSKKKMAFLAFQKIKNKKIFSDWRILSPSGDLKEAASNFFDFLHQLDESPAEIIFAEKVKEVGLGRAIMERLNKAAHQ
ncbi:MAG TPA: L-threonylcarbamoyladenylate synthase [Candidatus Paceibacterota bacterium]|nr:L-threonylcarbamoyladenylate synthase [Candidatus Paceibacterota bacterium]